MAQCLLQNKFVRQMKNLAKLGMKIFSPLAQNREVVCIYTKHEIDEPADDAEDETSGPESKIESHESTMGEQESADAQVELNADDKGGDLDAAIKTSE